MDERQVRTMDSSMVENYVKRYTDMRSITPILARRQMIFRRKYFLR